MKKIFLVCLAFLLVACSSTNQIKRYKIDSKTYTAKAKNHRIQFIILHYTGGTNKGAIKELTSPRVSAHYLILTGDDDVIYSLVPETERAWHAGVSEFRGKTNINDSSIGIEIVNEGIAKKYLNYPTFHPYSHYVAFEPTQIKKVAQLVRDISQRYNIPPRNIIAHSDIAPSRKTDPGAKFPWETLYKTYGLGAWYNENDKISYMNDGSYETMTIPQIKDLLRKYGYAINSTDEWDKDSQKVVYAFQLHFNPKNASGNMDLETYAILRALLKKYSY